MLVDVLAPTTTGMVGMVAVDVVETLDDTCVEEEVLSWTTVVVVIDMEGRTWVLNCPVIISFTGFMHDDMRGL